MTVSIGLAVYPADGEELGELLKLSDRAMYRDKTQSRAPSDCRARRRARSPAVDTLRTGANERR